MNLPGDVMPAHKKLVLFCDGTWNDLRMKSRTNVSRLAQTVKPVTSSGSIQLVYYDEGVGVSSGVSLLSDQLVRLMGGAFGRGMNQKIESAYRFLVLNYAPGDDIYLFGFSRGAFAARSLAGMIRKVDILKREYFAKCPDAFDFYSNKTLRSDASELVDFRFNYAHDVASGIEDYARYLDQSKLTRHMGILNAPTPKRDHIWELFQYRDTEATRETKFTLQGEQNVQAHEELPMRTYRLMYLGLWDTVASMGLPERLGIVASLVNSKYSFHDLNADPLISSIRHAVSIDENRRVFSATPISNVDVLNDIWAGHAGYSVTDINSSIEPEGPLIAGHANCYVPYRLRPYQQRWYPGDHGAVGGGNPQSGLYSHTLRWIAEGAVWAGLELDWSDGPLREAQKNENCMADWPNRGEITLLGRLGGYSRRTGPSHPQEIGNSAYERYSRAPNQIPQNLLLMRGQPSPRPVVAAPPGYPTLPALV
jgi:uncharacterized protein (DUF2235 family)